ncbi:MAG TPA: tetratricopeptide repeat protein [Gemmatimonadaceae bacterium]|nr:tetratricopeptide repeat protein [Gemmatimonadaceae bacterium]
MKATRAALACVGMLSLSASKSFAQTPTPVNLYVADLTYANGTVSVGTPRKLTGDRGVNSQPSFTPDGKAILFVSRRDTTGQSDVYRIDIRSGIETQVTRTAENENTPTVTPDGRLMVIRWVPATLFKEWGPWVYENGMPFEGVLPGPDTVGYYVRVDSVTFAMMRPKSRPAVALFNTRTKTMTDYAWPSANLPPQLVPGRRAITFTQTDSVGHNRVRMLDLRTLQSSLVTPTLVGRTVHSWTPRGFVLMAKGNAIYAIKPGAGATWKRIARMSQPDLQSLGTYIVSPKGDKVILTSPLKPSLVQVLTDSIQTNGRLTNAIAALRKNVEGTLAEYDVSEGGMLGLARQHANRGKLPEAIAIIRLAVELDPKSYDAHNALGETLGKSGDTAGAIAAYRKSLRLNPRVSDDDKKAAEAAEKAIAQLTAH